jgi:hypothetical protein
MTKTFEHPCPVRGCANKVYSHEPDRAGCLIVDWVRCWDHAPLDASVIVEYGKKAHW